MLEMVDLDRTGDIRIERCGIYAIDKTGPEHALLTICVLQDVRLDPGNLKSGESDRPRINRVALILTIPLYPEHHLTTCH